LGIAQGISAADEDRLLERHPALLGAVEGREDLSEHEDLLMGAQDITLFYVRCTHLATVMVLSRRCREYGVILLI